MGASYYYQPEGNKALRRIKKIFLWLLAFFFIAGFFYVSFFSYKFYAVGKKINLADDAKNYSFLKTVSDVASSDPAKLKNSDRRINILLLGIAGKGKPGQYLTDTIIIASLDLKKGRTALLSLPRDLYAAIPDRNISLKINSVYPHTKNILSLPANENDKYFGVGVNQSGINNRGNESAEDITLLKKTIGEITSLEINYYAVLNFDGFEKIIDSLSGINIENERDIFDPRYPGPNYSYETFELKKGFHHLDGATALKYARERHNDPEGDFGRAKRQQKVLQAVKNKFFSAGTFLNPLALNNLLNALGDNIKTDIAPDEIGSFLELSKKLDTQNITNVVADAWNKDSLLKVSHIYSGDTRSFILVPRVGNWSEVQDLAENIFELDKIKKRQAEIEKENASVLILNRSGDRSLADKIKLLLKDKLKIAAVNILTEREKNTSNETAVIDNTEGAKIFTLDELIKKLGAQLDKNGLDVLNLNKETDFIIILGEDLIEAHSFEEDSIEEYNAEF